jgi:hypothetical protein
VKDRNGDDKELETTNLDFEKFKKAFNYKKWKSSIEY